MGQVPDVDAGGHRHVDNVNVNHNHNHGIKKVLVVLPSFLPATLKPGHDGYKGTERSVVYILRELARRGIETHLIAAAGSEVPPTGKLYESCAKPLWDLGGGGGGGGGGIRIARGEDDDDSNNNDDNNNLGLAGVEGKLTPRSASREEILRARDSTIRLMREVAERERPDVVDCHMAHDEVVDAALAALGVPRVLTFNGPTKDRPELGRVVELHPDLPVIAVSALQSSYLRANYVGVVPNGLPEDAVRFRLDADGDGDGDWDEDGDEDGDGDGDRDGGRSGVDDKKKPVKEKKKKPLLMLARLSPKKDFPRGIEIARRAGRQLIIGGVLLDDQKDMQYWREVLAPAVARRLGQREDGGGEDEDEDGSASTRARTRDPPVVIRTDVTESNRSEFLAGGAALLALTKRTEDEWGPEYVEADGMHVTEALAAGLPVICDEGLDAAKVPPHVGVRTSSVDEAVAALEAGGRIGGIDPHACRRHFLENYTIGRTVELRLEIYARVIIDFNAS